MTPLLLIQHALRQRRLKYDPDQPRDDHGRWTNIGSSDSSVQDDLMDIIDVDDADSDYSKEEFASKKWMEKLTDKEHRALRAYRDYGKFESINNYMRSGSGNTQAREHAVNLINALDKGQIPDGTTVWRGMAVSGSVESESIVQALKGGAFTDNGFLSASPSSAIAAGFVESQSGVSVLFKLTTSNIAGAYISMKGQEPEYLLQQGSKISVSHVKAYQSGLIYVEGKISGAR